jgi:hypothetical protein
VRDCEKGPAAADNYSAAELFGHMLYETDDTDDAFELFEWVTTVVLPSILEHGEFRLEAGEEFMPLPSPVAEILRDRAQRQAERIRIISNRDTTGEPQQGA